jgi:C1A family cysteine protease
MSRLNRVGRYFPAIIVSVTVLLCLHSQAWCVDAFDWRAYPGSANLPAGNYITPVKNQVKNKGSKPGTCWAFVAIAALEAKVAITYKLNNPTIDLSEQNLICAGNQLGFGKVFDGGDAESAIDYFIATGVTTRNKVPYNSTDSSPHWPLRAPYVLYKITHMIWPDDYLLDSDPSSIKYYLKTHGPIVAAINAKTDFIYPKTGLLYPPKDPTKTASDDLGHYVLIVGYTDSSIPGLGGGHYTVKNSWGNTWGPTGNGYGYVSYATMQEDDYLTLIDGKAYMVPDPATLRIVHQIFVLLDSMNLVMLMPKL